MRSAWIFTLVLLLAPVLRAGEDSPPPLEPPNLASPAKSGQADQESKPASDAAAPAKSSDDDESTGTESEAGETMTVNFRDTEIVSVIDYYSKMLGKTFILGNQVKGKVTVISPAPIPKRNALAMLDTILSMQGFGLVETDGYIKVVQRDKVPRDSFEIYSTDTPSDRMVSAVLDMEFVTASGILEQIRPLLSQEGNAVVSERLNSLILTDTAGNIAKIRRIIQSLDKESKATQTRVYRLNFASSEKLATALPNLLAGGEKNSNLKPTVAIDADTNSLIVTGAPLIQRRMRELLPALDSRRGQVLIEAKIVEVSHTVTSRLGVEWEHASTRDIKNYENVAYDIGLSNFKLDDANLLAATSGLRTALISGAEWKALFNAYSTTEDVNLLSSPHLVAMDGQTATMHIGEEIPILKESRVDSNNNPVNTYDYEKVGIDLTIKPKILADREVLLELKQEVSTLIQFNEENLTHRIGERLAETHVILKDRHTLVIGGLMQDNVRKTTNGLPILKNIPILGKLFSQQSNTNSPEKTELLIFITPKIMKNMSESDNVSEEMNERHPRTLMSSGEEFRL